MKGCGYTSEFLFWMLEAISPLNLFSFSTWDECKDMRRFFCFYLLTDISVTSSVRRDGRSHFVCYAFFSKMSIFIEIFDPKKLLVYTPEKMWLAFSSSFISRWYCNRNCTAWSGENGTAGEPVEVFQIIIDPELLRDDNILRSAFVTIWTSSPSRMHDSSFKKFIGNVFRRKGIIFSLHSLLLSQLMHFVFLAITNQAFAAALVPTNGSKTMSPSFSMNVTHKSDRFLNWTKHWAPTRRCDRLFQGKYRRRKWKSWNHHNRNDCRGQSCHGHRRDILVHRFAMLIRQKFQSTEMDGALKSYWRDAKTLVVAAKHWADHDY